ncbi:MAG: ABC transporter permease [Ruminococcaceae bacterium]|nr:ABC transporter permease [Oscillospiraceae bacterium]
MRTYFAFLKKELLACARNGQLLLLSILFLALGIMNPAIAKLTPWLMETLSDSLADMGMSIQNVRVDALTSWTQFFKNIPLGLIAYVLLRGGSFTGEYESGTLILLLTKGLPRRQVLLAKASVSLGLWTLGYWLCFAVTYLYNDFFWENAIAVGLMPAALLWWLFSIWVLCLQILFSTLSRQYAGVLLGTGTCVLAVYLIGLLPKAATWTPTVLMDSASLLIGVRTPRDLMAAILITVATALASLLLALPILNKKQL